MDKPHEQIESLYLQEGLPLLGYLRRIVGDAEIAQDLLQETFVVALRAVDGEAGASFQRAWLFGVARKLALNTLRRRRATLPLPTQLGEIRGQEDPRAESMRNAMARLPAIQRETLELRVCEELSYEEIAEALEIPIGTVRSRLHNAVRRLREILKNTSQ